MNPGVYSPNLVFISSTEDADTFTERRVCMTAWGLTRADLWAMCHDRCIVIKGCLLIDQGRVVMRLRQVRLGQQ